jgi:hypothetical protein
MKTKTGQLSQLHIKKIKQICDKYSKDEEDLEFDIFSDKDSNNTKFLYLYFKDYSFGLQQSTTLKTVIYYLERKNIKKTIINEDDEHKVLIWIPIDKKINYLVMSPEEVYKCV